MKRGTTEHPKLLALCSILNLAKWEAVGILETIWHFTAKYAPQGDIGKYSDEAVARGIGWSRRSGRQGVTSGSCLVHALVMSGWLEVHPIHRIVVHDWADHADQTLRRFLASRKLAFVEHHASPPLPLPEPVPLPAPITARVQTIKATDLNGHTSQRFAEWWAKYPLQDDRDSAARMYVSVVTLENEPAVFACLERYLFSDLVARGVVMSAWKWLDQQHRNQWTGHWPAPKGAKLTIEDEAKLYWRQEQEKIRARN